MRGRPMPRSATWGTVIVRARREPPPGRPSSCRTSIGSLATSRLGSPAPTTASATTTSQVYLDEFAFRFDRRRTPMAAFQTLLGLASGIHGPTTYDMLYRSESAR